MKNPYKPQLVKVTKIVRETPDVKSFTLDKKLSFQPGQFMELSVLNCGEGPFCMNNYRQEQLRVTVRKVGHLTQCLHQLRTGDKVGVRGPYGQGYPMEELQGKDLVLVAGGTGIVPIRSVIEHLQRHRDEYGKVHLYLGSKTPQDIIFKKEIDKWKKDFKVGLTVDKADSRWKGKVGVVTTLLDKGGLPSHNCAALLCGPPVMIKFVVQSLKKLGFADHQIYTSLERLMHCGIGKCGHCMVSGKYVCRDGPVFRYDQVKQLSD